MSDFEKFIKNFKNQFKDDVKILNLKNIKKKDFRSITVFGMGGSGIVGDFIKSLASYAKINLPVDIIKNDKLEEENFYNNQTLFVGISFSGNTVETISIAKEIIKKGLKNNLIIETSGGDLENLAKKYNITLVKINPCVLTPRQGIGLMYSGIYKAFQKIFKLNDLTVKIKNESQILKYGKKIALQLKDKNIVIYSPFYLKHLGLFWKNNFNETSKKFCVFNTFPEIYHNEVESLKNIKGSFNFIFLKTKKEKQSKKIDFIKKILIKRRQKVLEIKIEGENIWEQTWEGVFLSYVVSYYLALQNKKMPFINKTIDELKKIN